MTDDGFERWLQDAAKGYHEPPATPRDAMWERVAASRVAAAPVRHAPTWGVRVAVAVGLAAMLLIGISIGRMSTRNSAQVASIVPAPTHNVVAPESLSTVAENPAPDTFAAPSPRAVSASVHAPQSVARHDAMYARSEPPFTGRARVSARDSLAYRDAALRHLSSAEALLTSFSVEAQSGQVHGDVADWATDMLSSTRLLLDSPAKDDRTLAPLLQDLELVLAQIARLRTQNDSADVDMATQALRQHDMIPRLRGASAPQPSGT